MWLSQERKEFSKWNKKDFSLFHKYYLLDIQNKQADTTFKNTYFSEILRAAASKLMWP